MKKYFVILLIVITNLDGFSQRSKPLNLRKYDIVKLHFGMALGFNHTDALIHNSDKFFGLDSIYSAECQAMPGFNINIIVNYNFNKYWGARFLPGLNFGQRNMHYVVYDGANFYEKIMQIESTYLDFPVFLQLKSQRVNNFRVYMITGLSYKFDLAAQKKIKEDDKPKIRLSRHVFSFEVGAGTDFFLQYFKFAIEARFITGLNNMIVPDNSQFTGSIESMKNQMFFVTLLFEGSDTDGLGFISKLFKRK